MSKKFAFTLFLFLSPLLILTLGYFIFDPFQILRPYESYPDNYAKSINRDRVSTQIFISNNPKYKYRSFIFGSSRSSVFYTENWAKYINDSNPYHFDASCEVISGIASKMAFIDKQNNKIDNALFIFDRGTFAYEQDTIASLFIQDYRVSKIPWWKYHLVFLKSYFSKGFFLSFYDFAITGKYKDYMRNFLEFRKISYTPISNNFIFTSYIEEIKKDSVKYYNKPNLFYERSKDTTIGSAVIKPYQLLYLKQIKALLQKNNTQYKIVIGPGYEQLYFNKQDLAVLQKYFGKENIYDFSGKNDLTNTKTNYYEIYHYKPNVANAIMQKIYATK